ncbi:MAG: FtsW/RodA/SpoVE family cell cycle protein [Firmicutes bacterium]|nr:FtsW/RodA/SpoVE family cell cycle protein [Bacillota bacterium]
MKGNHHENTFLDAVCSLIKVKAVHKNIRKELRAHIDDQKQAYRAKGISEEEAAAKAIEQMGDPLQIGKELNEAHKPLVEWPVLFTIAILTVVSGVMQYVFTMVGTHSGDDLLMSLFRNFLLYAPIGVLVFTVAYFFDYTLIKKHAWKCYMAYLLVMAVIFGTSPAINGALADAKYAALLFVPVYAGLVYDFRNKGYSGIIFSGIVLVPAVVFTILIPSASTVLLIICTCLAILTSAIKKGYFSCNIIVGLAIVYVPAIMTIMLLLLTLRSYQTARLVSMLTQYADPMGAGYLPELLRTIVTNAKPFGEILIENQPLEQLMPAPHVDLSFAFMIGKLGYIPALAAVALIFFLLYKLYRFTKHQRNSFGRLVSLGGLCIIFMQVISALLFNTGVYTIVFGIPPFLSYGAKQFAFTMGLLGLILSVRRRTNIVEDTFTKTHRTTFITFEQGKIIIDRGSGLSKKP